MGTNSIIKLEVKLPETIREEIQVLLESPQQYYIELCPAKASDSHTERSITLAQLNRSIPRQYCMMIISIGLAEVRDWFNVTNNLTDSQIALLSEMILDKYSDYSINEVKGVLRKQMQSAQVYNRLDGNIVMRWFAEYESERADAIYSERTASDWSSWEDATNDAISFEDYAELLTAKATEGDERSKSILADIEMRKGFHSADARKKEEKEFRKFKEDYLRKRLLGE